jgi:hypothetical protein
MVGWSHPFHHHSPALVVSSEPGFLTIETAADRLHRREGTDWRSGVASNIETPSGEPVDNDSALHLAFPLEPANSIVVRAPRRVLATSSRNALEVPIPDGSRYGRFRPGLSICAGTLTLIWSSFGL